MLTLFPPCVVLLLDFTGFRLIELQFTVFACCNMQALAPGNSQIIAMAIRDFS
jgi:hypothetical protein